MRNGADSPLENPPSVQSRPATAGPVRSRAPRRTPGRDSTWPVATVASSTAHNRRGQSRGRLTAQLSQARSSEKWRRTTEKLMSYTSHDSAGGTFSATNVVQCGSSHQWEVTRISVESNPAGKSERISMRAIYLTYPRSRADPDTLRRRQITDHGAISADTPDPTPSPSKRPPSHRALPEWRYASWPSSASRRANAFR